MIIKFFEKEKIEKVGLDFYLVYGDNEGQKKEVLENILKDFKGLTQKYDEKELLENNVMPKGSSSCENCQYLKKRWNISQTIE